MSSSPEPRWCCATRPARAAVDAPPRRPTCGTRRVDPLGGAPCSATRVTERTLRRLAERTRAAARARATPTAGPRAAAPPRRQAARPRPRREPSGTRPPSSAARPSTRAAVAALPRPPRRCEEPPRDAAPRGRAGACELALELDRGAASATSSPSPRPRPRRRRRALALLPERRRAPGPRCTPTMAAAADDLRRPAGVAVVSPTPPLGRGDAVVETDDARRRPARRRRAGRASGRCWR